MVLTISHYSVYTIKDKAKNMSLNCDRSCDLSFNFDWRDTPDQIYELINANLDINYDFSSTFPNVI